MRCIYDRGFSKNMSENRNFDCFKKNQFSSEFEKFYSKMVSSTRSTQLMSQK